MNKGITLLGGAGLGAGLMYLLDPDWGRRRRALVRDQAVRVLRQSRNAVDPTSRDLRNRAQGLIARATNLLLDEEVSDEVLVQRVRAQLGRFVSHPSSVEVAARQGPVTLRGPILAHQLEQTLAAVAAVRGVTSVNNQMEVHQQPGNVPGLQGGVPRPGTQFELMQTYWSPAVRFVVGATGSLVTFLGARRQGLFGTLMTAMGLSMVARGVTNMEMKRLLGIGAGRRAVDVQKTINVDVPLERAFNFWANFENFPRFMSNVREVKDLGNGRSRWTVEGPAGIPVTWNAVVTSFESNQVLAWRSEPGSAVANAGTVNFSGNARGGTQIDIQMSYNPPAGALGHTVASFFGSDPKTAMDEDLVRFKTLIEQGKTTADGKTVFMPRHVEIVEEA